ncbi:MAG: DNA polymerase III subunit delta, partial [Erysipelotrichaceae bacterium]
FHIDKKINEIITKFKTNDFDIHRYDGKSRGFSLQELVDDLMTIPFFSGTKIVLYKNPTFILNDKNSNEAVEDNSNNMQEDDYAPLLNYIKNPVFETDLVLYSYDYSFKTNTKVYKEIIKNANVFDYQLPKPNDFRSEAINIINKSKLVIENDAREQLIINSNNDYKILFDNIEKLLLYGDKIDKDVVSNLTDPYIEEQIFSFTNAIFDKDYTKTFRILNDFYTLNYSIFYLMAMLASQLRYLIQIAYYSSAHYSLDDIKRLTKTDKEYRIKKTLEIVRRFNGVDFLKYLDELSKLDISLKSNTELDEKIRFELFLVYMMEGK